MEIPIDYHLLFMMMSFIVFILTIIMLFSENISLPRAVAANILIVFNIVLNLIVAYSFSAINLYGYDSTGAIVNNVYSDMHPFIYIYWVFAWVNIMLLFYCIYIYLKKPWEEYIMRENRSKSDYFAEDTGEYFGQEY